MSRTQNALDSRSPASSIVAISAGSLLRRRTRCATVSARVAEVQAVIAVRWREATSRRRMVGSACEDILLNAGGGL
jgi:hypothetical protein